MPQFIVSRRFIRHYCHRRAYFSRCLLHLSYYVAFHLDSGRDFQVRGSKYNLILSFLLTSFFAIYFMLIIYKYTSFYLRRRWCEALMPRMGDICRTPITAHVSARLPLMMRDIGHCHAFGFCRRLHMAAIGSVDITSLYAMAGSIYWLLATPRRFVCLANTDFARATSSTTDKATAALHYLGDALTPSFRRLYGRALGFDGRHQRAASRSPVPSLFLRCADGRTDDALFCRRLYRRCHGRAMLPDGVVNFYFRYHTELFLCFQLWDMPARYWVRWVYAPKLIST